MDFPIIDSVVLEGRGAGVTTNHRHPPTSHGRHRFIKLRWGSSVGVPTGSDYSKPDRTQEYGTGRRHGEGPSLFLSST